MCNLQPKQTSKTKLPLYIYTNYLVISTYIFGYVSNLTNTITIVESHNNANEISTYFQRVIHIDIFVKGM